MSLLRSFISVPISEKVKNCIAPLMNELRTESNVKWELNEKLHITLKFLGNVEEKKLPSLYNQLTKTLQNFSEFDFTTEEIGAFPSLSHPKIFWIGIQPRTVFENLFSHVEHACSEEGFQKESRTFHPHITLGRVKQFYALDRLTAKIKSLTLEPTLSKCNTVEVLRSDLHPSGSRYTILQTIRLKEKTGDRHD